MLNNYVEKGKEKGILIYDCMFMINKKEWGF
jgi:hypothetical protein